MKAAQRTRTRSRPRAPESTPADGIDAFRAQHLDLATREIMTGTGALSVLVNDGESPLAWLARRKGRDGRTMISPEPVHRRRKTARRILPADICRRV